MQKYLELTEIVNYNNKEVYVLAMSLSKGCDSDVKIAKNCFEYVRDEIEHSGDCRAEITTLRASDVLKYKTGWCYAKSILLAGLLRANGIPTGFNYQRLSCSEYEKGIYCLHGLNSIYLKEFGWYRVDARGNKEGVNAGFNPPFEQLAFELGEGEFDLKKNFSEPLDEIILALKTNKNYSEMIKNFPDISNELVLEVLLKES